MLIYDSEFNEYADEFYLNNEQHGNNEQHENNEQNGNGANESGGASCNSEKLQSMLNNLDTQGKKINNIYNHLFPNPTTTS